MKYYFNTKSFSLKKVALLAIAAVAFSFAISECLNLISPDTEAANCTSSPCNTTFQVNVRETLAVQISTPTSGATGDINQFLRNKVSVNVTTNSTGGFTASMYSKTSTNLAHKTLSGTTIPTLTSNITRSSFPVNRWGYSLSSSSLDGKTYGETDAGNNSSRYYPLVSTSGSPIKLIVASAGTTTGSQDIYFGAKADATKPAGTYAGTVVISVVTGTIDNSTNPITPSNPATPNPTPNTATYTAAPTGSSNGSTVYTYSSTSGSVATTTTEVSEGNNVRAYSGYTPPQGVIEDTEMNIANSSTLAATLATTASLAAASGMFFFIAAKRRGDDDDEDEQQDVI